jgi:hypothetical protein
MPDRRFQVGQLPADFDRRRLLIEWEAFIRSGFSQIGFGSEVYRFLASYDYFGRPFDSDWMKAWSSHFNSTVAEVLKLIEIFSETPLARGNQAGFAGRVLADAEGRSLFEAMMQIMKRYRDNLLAVWDIYSLRIEEAWVQDRLDEERYFNRDRDAKWLRAVEADFRSFFRVEGSVLGHEIYITQELRDRFVRSMPKVTRLHQPILFARNQAVSEVPSPVNRLRQPILFARNRTAGEISPQRSPMPHLRRMRKANDTLPDNRSITQNKIGQPADAGKKRRTLNPSS